MPLLLALSLFCGAAAANDIDIRNARLLPAEEGGYTLSADFDVVLGERLEDALGKGVPLYFNVEFECQRPRWYWFDEAVVQKSYQARLFFHALTRTYRLSSGAMGQTFSNLGDALRALGSVRGWHVLNNGDLRPGATYRAGLRMSLDINQLPKPFQVSALANSEWRLNSNWDNWGFATDGEGKIAQ